MLSFYLLVTLSVTHYPLIHNNESLLIQFLILSHIIEFCDADTAAVEDKVKKNSLTNITLMPIKINCNKDNYFAWEFCCM